MTDQKFVRGQNRRDFLKCGTCAGVGLVLSGMGLSCCPKLRGEKRETSKGDNFHMMAYCCLRCDECDAYIATKNDDDKLRAEVAAKWNMKPEDVNCEGCKSQNALYSCSAKKCAQEKNVITCAHCKEFPSCDNELWTKWPQLRTTAEKVRKELGM